MAIYSTHDSATKARRARRLSMNDIYWMKEALSEASKAGWTTHPNPMVGAVIVRDGKELGRGYHHCAGMPHAEVEALRNAKENGFDDVSGATLYVTMEPCNHYGRTPPCTNAIIDAKIARCVIGTRDSNQHVCGGGVERLQNAGIPCTVGLCNDELRFLNRAFFTATRLNRPYITAKWAMSVDGKIATRTGHSKWITGDIARRDVHEQRALHDAIMVGTQTVIADDPQLNVRLDAPKRQPLRVIVDRQLRIPLSAKVFDTSAQKTVLFTCASNAPFTPYEAKGVAVECVELAPNTQNCDNAAPRLDLAQIFARLVERYAITPLYCEGGATLLGQLRDEDVVDSCHIYIAPKLIGGATARPAIAGLGAETMQQAQTFHFEPPQILGNDIRLTAFIDHL